MTDHAKDVKHKVKAKLATLKEDGTDIVDVRGLKKSLRILARDIKNTSSDTASDAMDYVSDRVDEVKSTGIRNFKRAEQRIKAKPAQSVAIAFAAGLLASFLMGGRKES